MSPHEITPRIEHVFARVFGARVPFSADMSRLNEPRWTSMKHVELIVGLEQEFGVRFDGADATDMTSVPVLVERVLEKLP
jgi:acyl carrier protein